jgi:4-hydroxythreonine-4-phosphate dehydrogenase
MMLLSGSLRFLLATRHIPLKEVPLRLHEIPLAVELAYQGLRTLFSIAHPRVVVCALNPHASDNGIIGREERELINPLICRLRRRYPRLEGPVPSDIAIARANRRIRRVIPTMTSLNP